MGAALGPDGEPEGRAGAGVGLDCCRWGHGVPGGFVGRGHAVGTPRLGGGHGDGRGPGLSDGC